MNLIETILASTDIKPGPNQVVDSPFLIATIHSTSGNTSARLFFPGDDDYSAVYYPVLQTGVSLSNGNKVLVAKVGGSFVILGKIGSGS